MSDRKPCAIEDCPGIAFARGWCQAHYARWHRNGDPTVVQSRGTGPQVRRLREQEALTGERVCATCDRSLALEAFPLDRRSRDGRRPHCAACWREIAALAHQRRVAKAPQVRSEKLRRYYLKSKYGITPADYDAMSEAQGGACAACGRVEQLVIDHCHNRGAVRALLCNDCNLALGHVRDDPAVLTSLITYLECHRAS